MLSFKGNLFVFFIVISAAIIGTSDLSKRNCVPMGLFTSTRTCTVFHLKHFSIYSVILAVHVTTIVQREILLLGVQHLLVVCMFLIDR